MRCGELRQGAVCAPGGLRHGLGVPGGFGVRKRVGLGAGQSQVGGGSPVVVEQNGVGSRGEQRVGPADESACLTGGGLDGVGAARCAERLHGLLDDGGRLGDAPLDELALHRVTPSQIPREQFGEPEHVRAHGHLDRCSGKLG